MAGEAVNMMVEEAKKEFEKYWERGQYFHQQGDKNNANKNFVLGFEQFSRMIYMGYNAENYDDKTKIVSLFSLYNLLDEMYTSFYDKEYSHKTILAYLLINMEKIIDHLSDFESSFRVDDIKRYKGMCDSIKVPRLAFTIDFSTELSEEMSRVKSLIESTKPDQTTNETLKKLRNSLKQISQISFSPKFESNSNGCFIATAAYSTSIHPDLDTFRKFRDHILLTNPLGSSFVSVYYQIGPILAKYVSRNFHLKKLIRFLLEKLASFMRSHSQI